MLDMIKVIIIGIVEGITEWLPISSTGHMILVNEILNVTFTESFEEVFLVVIQLGAIAAVGVLFFKKLNPLVKDKEQRDSILRTWLKIIIATIPAGIIGVLFDDWLNEKLYNYIVVAVMLIIYGVVFIVVERRMKDKKPSVNSIHDLSYKTALFIGFFQVLALIPGTSRSGVTIIGALVLGTSRFVATEFSFFLSIPVMVGASFYKLVKVGLDFSSFEWAMMLVGLVTAFIVSFFAIRFLVDFVKKHTFKVFGYYRIGLGIIVLAYFLITLTF